MRRKLELVRRQALNLGLDPAPTADDDERSLLERKKSPLSFLTFVFFLLFSCTFLFSFLPFLFSPLLSSSHS